MVIISSGEIFAYPISLNSPLFSLVSYTLFSLSFEILILRRVLKLK